MNHLPFPAPLTYYCRNLGLLLDIWTSGDPVASKRFTAITILDFTARVARALADEKEPANDPDPAVPTEPTGVSDTDSEPVTSATATLHRARELIRTDPAIRNMIDCVTCDDFEHDLREFITAYETDGAIDPGTNDEMFGLVHSFFRLELVIDSLNQAEILPPHLDAAAIVMRSMLADAFDRCPELAEAARTYAEHAPGGPEMAPWPDLLDSAPDSVWDALQTATILEHQSHRSLSTSMPESAPSIRFIPDSSTMKMQAAADAIPDRLPDVQKLVYRSDTWSVAITQINDVLFLELTGSNLDTIPEPIIEIDGNPLDSIPSINPETGVRHTLGPIRALRNRTITVVFPGLPVSIPSITIDS
ncbi:hypothetical protein JXA80_02745 [bacterium]|nr:hypothetical protein [candidate division CSSED10-310 bacterium]